MEKLISAKVAARETIKARLENEIPPINEAIQKAMEKGVIRIYYDGPISKATRKMLKRAGYVVRNWKEVDMKTEIMWNSSYNKAIRKASEVKKIEKNLNLEMVEPQEPQTTR